MGPDGDWNPLSSHGSTDIGEVWVESVWVDILGIFSRLFE